MAGCKSKDGLESVRPEHEAVVADLLRLNHGIHGWKRRADEVKDGKLVQRTPSHLCAEHYPAAMRTTLVGLKVARLPSTPSARLQWGRVTGLAPEIPELGVSTRQQQQATSEEETPYLRGLRAMAQRPTSEWMYSVTWADGSVQHASGSQLQASVDLAKLVDAETSDAVQAAVAEAQRQHAALHMQQVRASSSQLKRATEAATTAAARTVRTVVDAKMMPNAVQRALASFAARPRQQQPEVIDHIQTETPFGTMNHDGSMFLFDVNQRDVGTQTVEAWQEPGHRLVDWFSSAHFEGKEALFQRMFGFRSWGAAEDFLRKTWLVEPDEPGRMVPTKLTMMDEYLLTLWRMKQREDHVFLETFAGVSHGSLSNVINHWIPQFGSVGRSAVWLPSTDYIDATVPASFVNAGMQKVAYIGDCTDILTETVRKIISVRNQQHSDKSKHSAAMGISWCTPTGWTAVASDLVFGRTSEYQAAVSMAGSFSNLPSHYALCYDKGVASLRAHLPNLNNVVVPCFLSGGHYSAEDAIRNRAVATNRYVIEITYQRVKQWKMLQPVVPWEQFDYINHVWWWGLGFGNIN